MEIALPEFFRSEFAQIPIGRLPEWLQKVIKKAEYKDAPTIFEKVLAYVYDKEKESVAESPHFYWDFLVMYPLSLGYLFVTSILPGPYACQHSAQRHDLCLMQRCSGRRSRYGTWGVVLLLSTNAFQNTMTAIVLLRTVFVLRLQVHQGEQEPRAG
jgi:hypothetical protein